MSAGKKPAPKLSIDRPTSRTAEKFDEGEKRITFDVPLRVYTAVRKKAFERGITVRDYFEDLLKRDGIE